MTTETLELPLDIDEAASPPSCAPVAGSVGSAPSCPTHKRAMVRYQPGTPEQAFCVADGGEWWKCESCTCSVIRPGNALRVQWRASGYDFCACGDAMVKLGYRCAACAPQNIRSQP